MTQVTRQELEQSVVLDRAITIVDKFLNDRESDPDDDVRVRRGICKALAEEYLPLVRVAQMVPSVESVRLLSEANEGPDGEIHFREEQCWNVQATCAHEGYQRHLLREQLQQDGIAQPGNRRRDRHSGQVVCETTPLFRPDEEVEVRLNRICSAVQAKEENYHTGTDTLLVLEQPAAYLREHNLHARVVNVLHERSSNYERIYVIYGSVVQQVK